MILNFKQTVSFTNSQASQGLNADKNVGFRGQPLPNELARDDIKARDFAYESQLPPIRSIMYRQIQPAKRDLTSMKADSDDNPRALKRPRPLARVPTEIIMVEDSQNSQGPNCTSNQWETSPRRMLLPATSPRNLHHQSPLLIQLPSPARFESQQSEIDTPLVTPTGSFFHDRPTPVDVISSGVDSQSQFSNIDPPVSYSQLGFTPSTSQADNSQAIASLLPSHPISLRSKTGSYLSLRTSSLIRRNSSHLSSTTPRYFLRKRKVISYYANTRASASRAKQRGHNRGSSNMKRSVRRPGKT
jgi:hypothetical protein